MAKTLRIALPILAAIMLAAIYWPVVHWLAQAWASSPGFSHGALVTPLCVLILWTMRKRLLSMPRRPTWAGLVFVAPAAVMRLWDLGAAELPIAAFGIPFLFVGVVWTLLGSRAARFVAIPGFVPLLGFPWPTALYSATWMRVEFAVAGGGAELLNRLMSTSAVRAGVMVKLPELSQQVGIQAAAMRTVLVFLTFSALYAYLVSGPVKGRWITFAAGVPIAIAGIAIRILMDGFVEYVLGPQSLRSFHPYSGYIALMIAFFGLVVLAGALGCGEIRLGSSSSMD